MISRRRLLIAIGAGVCLARVVRAQERKIYRVGIIVPSTTAAEWSRSSALTAFTEQLQTLGYVENSNLILDYVIAEGHPERYGSLAAELIARRVDVIVTAGSQMAVAVHNATRTVPIVMMGSGDPVKDGLVESLARPKGNVTGVTAHGGPEIEGKRLQLLKDIVPKLSRVSVIATRFVWESVNGQETRKAAEALGLELFFAEHRPADLEATFRTVVSQRPDACFISNSADAYVPRQFQQMANFALTAKLPSSFPSADMAEAGGLMSYGFVMGEFGRLAALDVAKILEGAKPGNLPVQLPTRYELVVNVKTAKALGLPVPQSILLRADRLIE